MFLFIYYKMILYVLNSSFVTQILHDLRKPIRKEEHSCTLTELSIKRKKMIVRCEFMNLFNRLNISF